MPIEVNADGSYVVDGVKVNPGSPLFQVVQSKMQSITADPEVSRLVGQAKTELGQDGFVPADPPAPKPGLTDRALDAADAVNDRMGSAISAMKGEDPAAPRGESLAQMTVGAVRSAMAPKVKVAPGTPPDDEDEDDPET